MTTNPEMLECDLVMRGGITSVIVYPKAIAKLAETYKFRCIGGTSAGAIAATAAAAGALGVRNGSDSFKEHFEKLPEKLATVMDGKTVLLRVFQPAKELERVFAVLLSGLQRQTFAEKVASVLLSLCGNYWSWAVVGAAIVAIPLVLASAWRPQLRLAASAGYSSTRTVRHSRGGNRPHLGRSVPLAQERLRYLHRDW